MYSHQVLIRCLAAAVLGVVLLVPAAASGAEGDWHLRVAAAWVDPDLSFDGFTGDGDRIRADSDSTVGVRLAIERRYTDRLGLEIAATFTEPDLDLRLGVGQGRAVRVSDSFNFVPLSAGLNIHLTPDRPVDLYFGPKVAWVNYGNLNFDVPVDGQVEDLYLRAKDDYGWGVQVGADVPFGGGPWAFSATVEYLDVTLELRDEEGETYSSGFDPLQATVGFSYTF